MWKCDEPLTLPRSGFQSLAQPGISRRHGMILAEAWNWNSVSVYPRTDVVY